MLWYYARGNAALRHFAVLWCRMQFTAKSQGSSASKTLSTSFIRNGVCQSNSYPDPAYIGIEIKLTWLLLVFNPNKIKFQSSLTTQTAPSSLFCERIIPFSSWDLERKEIFWCSRVLNPWPSTLLLPASHQVSFSWRLVKKIPKFPVESWDTACLMRLSVGTSSP